MVKEIKINNVSYFMDEEEWEHYKNWYNNLIYGKESIS